MKSKIIILFTVLSCLLSCYGGGDDSIPNQEIRIQNLLNNYYDDEIVFENTKLQEASVEFNNLVISFSSDKNPDNLFLVQNQWRVFIDLWKSLEVLTVGPRELTNQVSQIHQWPTDQVRINGFINSEEIINESFVLAQGTNTRGLAAAEYLIFGKELSTFVEGNFADRQTDYLLAISQSLIGIVDNYVSLWEAHEEDFKSELSNSISGSQNQIVNALIFKLEEIIKDKLQAPLSIDTGGDVNITLAEAYLSEDSKYIINREIRQIEKVFTGDYILTNQDTFNRPEGLYDQLSDFERDDLVGMLENQFREIEINIRAIDVSLEEQLVTDSSKVFELVEAIENLSALVKADVANALSIVITNDTNAD